MKPLLKLIFQTIFFVTVFINVILVFFFSIAVFYRLNGMKSLNPKEFLFSGIIILVLSAINFLFYKNKNLNYK